MADRDFYDPIDRKAEAYYQRMLRAIPTEEPAGTTWGTGIMENLGPPVPAQPGLLSTIGSTISEYSGEAINYIKGLLSTDEEAFTYAGDGKDRMILPSDSVRENIARKKVNQNGLLGEGVTTGITNGIVSNDRQDQDWTSEARKNQMLTSYGSYNKSVGEVIYDGLKEHEGASGDKARTDVETGKLGLTNKRANEVAIKIRKENPGQVSITDTQIIQRVIKDDQSRLYKIKGYDKLADNLKVVLGDLSYNLNANKVATFKALEAAINNGNTDKILLETLDTVSVYDNKAKSNKNMRGVAKRRAIMYNSAIGKDVSKRIHKIKQLKIGRIQYFNKAGKLIKQTKSNKNTMHSKSTPGVIILKGAG